MSPPVPQGERDTTAAMLLLGRILVGGQSSSHRAIVQSCYSLGPGNLHLCIILLPAGQSYQLFSSSRGTRVIAPFAPSFSRGASVLAPFHRCSPVGPEMSTSVVIPWGQSLTTVFLPWAQSSPRSFVSEQEIGSDGHRPCGATLATLVAASQ